MESNGDKRGPHRNFVNLFSVDVPRGRGACAAGDVRRYPCWYRDPVTSPCGTPFNLTNGYEITWTP
jgi:hypothetical protein